MPLRTKVSLICPQVAEKKRPASYNSNVMALDRTKIRGVHEIRHFACEGDFYTFQNHMYKTMYKTYVV